MNSYNCYICGERAEDKEWWFSGYESDEEPDVLVPPEGWSVDDRGRDRCPKHKQNKQLATLGEMIQSKAR